MSMHGIKRGSERHQFPFSILISSLYDVFKFMSCVVEHISGDSDKLVRYCTDIASQTHDFIMFLRIESNSIALHAPECTLLYSESHFIISPFQTSRYREYSVTFLKRTRSDLPNFNRLQRSNQATNQALLQLCTLISDCRIRLAGARIINAPSV